MWLRAEIGTEEMKKDAKNKKMSRLLYEIRDVNLPGRADTEIAQSGLRGGKAHHKNGTIDRPWRPPAASAAVFIFSALR